MTEPEPDAVEMVTVWKMMCALELDLTFIRANDLTLDQLLLQIPFSYAALKAMEAEQK